MGQVAAAAVHALSHDETKGGRSCAFIEDPVQRKRHLDLLRLARLGDCEGIRSLAAVQEPLDLGRTDGWGRNALWVASMGDHAEAVRMLMGMRADPADHAPNSEGILNIAANHGRQHAVQALLQCRADVNLKDVFGRTPIMDCREASCARLLLESRAALEARLLPEDADPGEDMATPLILAAKDGRTEMVEVLVAARADLHACNSFGLSALEVAAGGGDSKAALTLLAAACASAHRSVRTTCHPDACGEPLSEGRAHLTRMLKHLQSAALRGGGQGMGKGRPTAMEERLGKGPHIIEGTSLLARRHPVQLDSADDSDDIRPHEVESCPGCAHREQELQKQRRHREQSHDVPHDHPRQDEALDTHKSGQAPSSSASAMLQEREDSIRLLADPEDVEIGKAVNSRGEDVPLETVFSEIYEALQGELAQQSTVKHEDFELATLPVDSLRYTQESCSPTFKCGRRLVESIDAFVRGMDPSKQPWCILRVVRRNGLLLSVDNRRLHAMKEAQRILRERDPTVVVWARAKLYTWTAALDAFLSHLDHRCLATDGQNIRVRAAKRHRSF